MAAAGTTAAPCPRQLLTIRRTHDTPAPATSQSRPRARGGGAVSTNGSAAEAVLWVHSVTPVSGGSWPGAGPGGGQGCTVRTTRPPSPDIINIIQPSLLSADINGNKIFLKTQKLSHINHVYRSWLPRASDCQHLLLENIKLKYLSGCKLDLKSKVC